MRRTYRSKKDTRGGLDHKNVLLTLDERSSTFDAFYIQKLKQTKRELSCVGASSQYATAPNKIRKKKFVKRIVKEVGNAYGESMSQSTYLTPDKSIRVNKGQDLFDQLLNTSSPRQLESKLRNNDLFNEVRPVRPTKTYGTRKTRKVKKYNYSSSESSEHYSNSDKENKTSDISTNVTDIRAHKLIVEKDVPNSPKYQDESINKIVQKLSIFNNINHLNDSSGSPVISFSKNINRKRTKPAAQQLQSTVLDKSILSSTPFKNIRTATSIYKLSPISKVCCDASTSYVTIDEENKEKDIIDDLKSPLVKKPAHNVFNIDKLELSDVSVIENNKTEPELNIQNVECQKLPSEAENLECVSVLSESFNESVMHISLGGSKPSEVFLGFTGIHDVAEEHKQTSEIVDVSRVDESMNAEASNSLNCSELELSLGGSKPSEPFFGFDVEDEQDDNEHNRFHTSHGTSETDTSKSNTPDSQNVASFYDTCSSENDNSKLSNEFVKEPIINVTRMNDVVFHNYYNKMTRNASDHSSDEENDEYNESSSSQEGNLLDSKHDDLEVPPNNDVMIKNNEDDLSNPDEHLKPKTYRFNPDINEDSVSPEESGNETNTSDSKHYDLQVLPNNEMVKNDEVYSDDLSNPDEYLKPKTYRFNPEIDEDIVSPEESGNETDTSDSKHDDLQVLPNNEMVKNDEAYSDDPSNPDEHLKPKADGFNSKIDENSVSPQESENESDMSCFDDLESNSNDDDEIRCFVNTRRKIIVKTSSNKSSSNDSSSISSECNMTVLSNKLIINSTNNVQSLDQSNLLSSTEECIHKKGVNGDKNNFNGNETDLCFKEIEELKEGNIRDSFVTTRNSSKNWSFKPNSPECSKDNPAIVLQPGKKWERSLSIYRRMTMMNDHFDKSVLDDESLNCKGRKYRQSVISTMEMQEGSLHNESISSRRSTFVAKPCRSTIVIIKEPSNSRASLCNSTVYDDLRGFLSDDCDDTIVELSKLSIVDSEHEVTVVEKLHEERSTTARDYVLRRCNQTEAILFDECYPDTALKNCHKIGEGVYGEVFLWRARDGRARVMKIVPVAGTTKVNGEDQKDFQEIISEIVIAMELSALRTPIAELERQFDEGKKDIDTLDLHAIQNATDIFNEVLAVRCVYGSYTSRLLDLWELYDECKGSENDNPAILPSDQQFIVLELANAGQDLESYQFNSAEQAHALFLQVAFGLAVGEEAFQFEHRDLHWGNVLISPTEQKFATFVLRGRSHRVARRGVAAAIIDYSLSRLTLPLAADSAALYNDLATDDGLFDAVGDYQFEVYRLMRDKLGNDWKNFEPYTNILWLHYVVDKMITALRYKRTNTKIHKHYISKLKAIKNRILTYGSAVQFVLTDIEY